ncbi:response regulator [Chitinophaga vietnamensis]|uniref:response regulator n=1 Tax=Chitinophaga vietnamensis TaxID=2593957 RepID=UPI0011789C33|nr:response regulator [Chitinophaga vietnamensis]
MLPALLLVDDEEEILDFLERALEPQYTVFRADNVPDALQILEKEAIHLVISDVIMPVTDGLEFCRIIKSTLAFSHIPVILLTARNTLQSKIEGLELGADAYIEKPFSKQHLLAQITSLLHNRMRMQEYFSGASPMPIKHLGYSRLDEQFLESLNELIFQYMEKEELNVDLLAKSMNMSRPTLYRKIKMVSGMAPSEFINITRLKKAAELLVLGQYKIYEVALMTGFGSQSNFTRSFSRHFNITPTAYLAAKRNA